jgi:hypothetical protein
MKFKKRILISSIALATMANANQFKIIIDGEDVSYITDKPISTDITYSDWVFQSETNCNYSPLVSEVYKGESFNQDKTCDIVESRTSTITTTYESGKIVTEDKKETKTTSKTEQISLVGTHLEPNCKDILDNGYSKGSGNYELTNNVTLYCDMTNENGGWSKIATINHSNITSAEPDTIINDQGIDYTEVLVLDYGTSGNYYTPDNNLWHWQGFDLGKMVFKIGNNWTMPQISEFNQSGCENITNKIPMEHYQVLQNTALCQGNGNENRPHLCASKLKITLPSNQKVTAFNDVESIMNSCTADNIMHYNFEVFVR